MQVAEQAGEVRGGKHGGRATPEVEGFGFSGKWDTARGLNVQRINESTDGRATGRVLVERAVGADAVTEGDV